jgi:type II secretory pathway pseudopilin PulG
MRLGRREVGQREVGQWIFPIGRAEMRHDTQRGISLVELIVVLGVIVLLIAIAIPTVAAVRRSAKVTQCASNLRQIGQAIHAYRSNHKAWPFAAAIPAPFGPMGLSPPGAPSIPDALAAFLPPTTAVYHCPGDTHEVYDRCGISYLYWTIFHFPKKEPIMMTDFQGYSSPARTVTVSDFHPPRLGLNQLNNDGSVEFGHARPDGP